MTGSSYTRRRDRRRRERLGLSPPVDIRRALLAEPLTYNRATDERPPDAPARVELDPGPVRSPESGGAAVGGFALGTALFLFGILAAGFLAVAVASFLM